MTLISNVLFISVGLHVMRFDQVWWLGLRWHNDEKHFISIMITIKVSPCNMGYIKWYICEITVASLPAVVDD